MILAKPTEKLESISKLDFIINHMRYEFTTKNIVFNVPDNCLSKASELCKVGLQPIKSYPNDNEIENGKTKQKEFERKNLQFYYDTLEKLLDFLLDGKLHWRHHNMATEFISMIAHPEHLLPIKGVKYFFNALIHDSINERKLAWNMTVQILFQLKKTIPKVYIFNNFCTV